MDNQQIPTINDQQFASNVMQPQPENVPVENQQYEKANERVRKTSRLVTILIYIILFIIVLALLFSLVKVTPEPTEPVKPVEISASPTPIQTLSTVATTSAFLKMKDSNATLSAMLQEIQLEDSRLAPPAIELPLGFSN